jgi:hypothetical protein
VRWIVGSADIEGHDGFDSARTPEIRRDAKGLG